MLKIVYGQRLVEISRGDLLKATSVLSKGINLETKLPHKALMNTVRWLVISCLSHAEYGYNSIMVLVSGRDCVREAPCR